MRTAEGGLREQHKARRRMRILEATRELLRHGPDSVISAERIAERAEVAPATVYNLIGPRDKIWEGGSPAYDRARFDVPGRDRVSGGPGTE